MSTQHEHEFEAAPGLPEKLPAGEHIIWQGAPEWRSLGVSAFGLRTIAMYLLVMWLLQFAHTCRIHVVSCALMQCGQLPDWASPN